ncbi:hypothetical protein PTKIN_Ptkin08bG0172800 [Pterospermum kingtungense]
MSRGWRAFAKDNNLVVGDICVFELIKHPEILLKAAIYPVIENASKVCRPPADGSIGSRVKIRSMVGADSEPNCRQSQCPSSSRECKVPKIEENENSHPYIEVLDEFPLNQKTKKKLPSPCFQPCKIMRTNPSGSIQADGIKLENQKKSMDSQYLTKELRDELKYSAKNDSGGMSGARGRLKPGPEDKMQPLTQTQKEKASIRASTFNSANPSFTILMQPSYVLSKFTPHIPYQFAKRYFEENGELSLRVSDGRTWTVGYKVCRLYAKVRFSCNSWRAFVVDNNLKVGDICVFELIKDNGILLDVVIFPAARCS